MHSSFPQELTTARLVLRRLEPGDAARLCSYRALPEVARYQSWESFGPEDAARLIDEQRGREFGVPGTWLQLALVEAATRILIGDCGLHCPPADPRQIELGITLSPTHQGHGYATEAVRGLLDLTFGTFGMHRVSAVTDVNNLAAAALFQRLGFRQEAHFVQHVWYKGGWGSEYVFAMLRQEWELRPKEGDSSLKSR